MQVNRKNVTRRNPRRGISLLEIMVVLAIIALVAGLAAPRIMETFGRAKSQAASIQLQSIKGALQLFYIDVGRYPSEIEGLEALLVEPDGVSGWRGPYLDDPDGLSDPWGPTFRLYPSRVQQRLRSSDLWPRRPAWRECRGQRYRTLTRRTAR